MIFNIAEIGDMAIWEITIKKCGNIQYGLGLVLYVQRKPIITSEVPAAVVKHAIEGPTQRFLTCMLSKAGSALKESPTKKCVLVSVSASVIWLSEVNQVS